RLEIRAEEEPRRSEYVVAIRIGVVAIHVRVQDRGGKPGERPVDVERAQERRVYRALGQPQLIPVDPEPIVKLSRVHGAADAAPMRLGLERIELEQGAVSLAAASLAREQRFLGRHEQRAAADDREV